MAKFSEISLESFGLESQIKLNPKQEPLEDIVKEFQNDLKRESKNNLSFIKFVVSIIKENRINFPVLPQVANKILELSNNPDSVFNDYANIIRGDSAITLKVIKLANSPLFRASKNISDIELAMSRIGVNGIKEIVLVDSLKSIVFRNENYKSHIENIWKTSLITALVAARLANYFKINSSMLYTVSLVHRIGSVLIFDIVNDFNQNSNDEDYLLDDFAHRIGDSFNKRLTVNILKNWSFTKKQIMSVKNYNIKPVPVAPIEHKLLYLSQITVNALDVIMLEYGDDSIFPYTFMLKEASIELEPIKLKEIVDNSLKYYDDFLKFLYS